jgi:hypothetical protein
MANELNTEIETDYYAFLNRILVTPDLLKRNPGELQTVINKLLLLNNTEQLKEIRNQTFSMLKLDPPLFTNSFIAVQEIRKVIIELSQSSQVTRTRTANEIRNETYVNRVRTADKQSKVTLDFVKG